MKKLMSLSLAAMAAVLVQAGGSVRAEELTVAVHIIDAGGVGQEIGTIEAKDGPGGLMLTPTLSGLTPGSHGFHVHERPDCGPAEKDGQMTAGLGAGGHLDPQKTGKHAGPLGEGHLGDLPLIEIDQDGRSVSKDPLVAPRLKVADLHGHSFIIHAKGDTYSDQPAPLGGAGARVACGIVP